ncbi:ATP-dependent Clp protease proteolytic subunit [Methylobacterium indicum]|uniref:ATP-dependent Clp protease proteolytic subunit n=1 Tax=Methylobacterium indicum TaxID=1775910 RepID=UPI002436091B|nr:ATP-dependent Clp protease proteolytic subunit [Methylobacterium indicum]
MIDAYNNDEKESDDQLPAQAPKIVEDALFQGRYVMITGPINDKIARAASERLLALAAKGNEPINVFISSPGGHVESGDMIHDVIRFIAPEVRTIGAGWVASAGALIFVSVPLHRRFCLPNTRFLLHQPSGGIGGRADDVQIQADEILKMRERFYRIFAAATGQPVERIKKDMRRDFWLDTEAALEYGLLGRIVERSSDFDTSR